MFRAASRKRKRQRFVFFSFSFTESTSTPKTALRAPTAPPLHYRHIPLIYTIRNGVSFALTGDRNCNKRGLVRLEKKPQQKKSKTRFLIFLSLQTPSPVAPASAVKATSIKASRVSKASRVPESASGIEIARRGEATTAADIARSAKAAPGRVSRRPKAAARGAVAVVVVDCCASAVATVAIAPTVVVVPSSGHRGTKHVASDRPEAGAPERAHASSSASARGPRARAVLRGLHEPSLGVPRRRNGARVASSSRLLLRRVASSSHHRRRSSADEAAATSTSSTATNLRRLRQGLLRQQRRPERRDLGHELAQEHAVPPSRVGPRAVLADARDGVGAVERRKGVVPFRGEGSHQKVSGALRGDLGDEGLQGVAPVGVAVRFRDRGRGGGEEAHRDQGLAERGALGDKALERPLVRALPPSSVGRRRKRRGDLAPGVQGGCAELREQARVVEPLVLEPGLQGEGLVRVRVGREALLLLLLLIVSELLSLLLLIVLLLLVVLLLLLALAVAVCRFVEEEKKMEGERKVREKER